MKQKIETPLAGLSGAVTLGGELTLCRLGFGAMRLTGDGIWGPPKDPAAAVAVLRRAVELGVNFIDTADSYGPLWDQAKWPVRYFRGLRRLTKKRLCRLRWPGC